MALSVEEPQLGCIISGRMHSQQQDTPRQLQVTAADWIFTIDPSLTPLSLLKREYGDELTHSLRERRSHHLKTTNVTDCKTHPVSFLLVSTQER